MKVINPTQMEIIPSQAPIRHLYIHIPFCHRRCSYCDFNTYANMEDRIGAYVDALCAELHILQKEYIHRWGAAQPGNGLPTNGPLMRADLRPTIFFGGGTPSMLPLDALERILRAADQLVPLANAEITLEANPGTVLGRDYLRGLRDLGVNRLSMGVQSLHDPTLRMLGRIHTAAEAQQSYEEARAAGFDNINLDFIFGLPNQSVDQWAWTLDQITSWGTEHFSLYSLILEEGTPLHAQVIGGRLSIPDDDATAEMYELAMERFAAAGYVQYEISNWSRGEGQWAMGNGNEAKDSQADPIAPRPLPIAPFACHHNLAYWLNADYGAAGAGAHGHVFPRRYADILGIDNYIKAVRAGERPVAEVIELATKDLWAETMFMGLRLNSGVGLAHFRERCGIELADAYGSTIDELITLGLLEQDDRAVRLTNRGRMLGNQVFERFV